MILNQRKHANVCSKHRRTSKAITAVTQRWRNHSNIQTTPNLSGARVMDLTCLSHAIETISQHSTNCQEGKCSLVGEVQREGLGSTLEVVCDGCNSSIRFPTSSVTTASGDLQQRYSANVGAVWGQLATGGGHRALNEQLAALNVPGMSKSTFSKIEGQLGQEWESILCSEMLKADEEERRLAVERGDYDQGVPAITVVIDGGWSKRSHKHSYNAKSGMAVIVGKETNKLLYLGIRNKFCSICTVAQNKHTVPKEHKCFKNWEGSSAAMESDILVTGFNEAEYTHGLRYMRVIGDGDSSVMANIQQYVPLWGNRVEKIECANHAVKCYHNRLEQIIQVSL